jgi:hypothetical protein
MILNLQRRPHNGRSTIGDLTVGDLKLVTIEDPPHDIKIYGCTRIPAGEYEIKLRTEGRLYNKYKDKIPHFKGMLWLQNVPNFNLIYIHIGNTSQDTLGCILVGMNADSDDFISESTVAFIRLYAYVIDAMDMGEKVTIKIMD